MHLTVGTKIYCHTTGHMNGNGAIFALKGKTYKITNFYTHQHESIRFFNYSIIDEKGSHHTFPLDELISGSCKWFTINNKVLLIENNMKNFYLNKVRLLPFINL